ncbi:MAG: hypothetical protein QG653_625 [Patescibacteria group bacterium]|nr:hypothetical protein [Patescibacteria group bacterium]
MKLRNIILGIVLFPSLLITYAQGDAVTQVSLENILQQKPQAILLASVNLYDPSISYNTKTRERFISFVLETKDPVQRDVRYRIALFDQTGALAYTHTFNESITLLRNLPLSITKSFPVPVDLNGTYSATINVVNREGLPLATGTIKNVTFGSGSIANFSITSCAPLGRVYDKQEPVTVVCNITGETSLASKAEYTIYRGNRAQRYSGGSVSLGGNKFSFSFPAPARADAYSITIQANENGALIGKTLIVPFAVRGNVSNILSISADKQSYRKGDSANISVGLNLFTQNKQAIYAEVALASNDQSYMCGPVVRTELTRNGGISFSVPIINDCDGFSLSARLLDSNGRTLDEDMLVVDQERRAQFIGFLNFFLIFSSGIILLSAFIHKRRHTKRT